MNSRYLSGTIIMSMPALTDFSIRSSGVPGSSSMPFQSDTMMPWNPSSPFNTSVMRWRCPCIFSPFQLLNDTMTDPTPALIAAT